MSEPFRFDNTYALLSPRLFSRQAPDPVSAPRLRAFNAPLAESLGLDFGSASEQQITDWFSGNAIPAGADPLAMAYAGHQFGHFVPQLGDGRALLLGEVTDPSGRQWDIQLKGSGRTAFSRGGDGRSALGPVIREYLVSEAMHALGVPTTRALAAVTTGEVVHRGGEVPGGILTRVARSHLRVGTFQYFATREDVESLQTLVDYAFARLYPDVGETDRQDANQALDLLEQVMHAQVRLVSQWLSIGFIHGVMNTDNSAISGETIDYGPCAFLDEYHPAKVFSSIDRNGRYAYANQPNILLWNLARLGEALLPVIDRTESVAIERVNELLSGYPALFKQHWLNAMRPKLGLTNSTDATDEQDADLVQGLLDLMQVEEADFTVSFRALSHAVGDSGDLVDLAKTLSWKPSAWTDWKDQWLARLEREPEAIGSCQQRMLQTNPAVIPRNHQIERAIQAAEQREDFSVFEALQTVLAEPFVEHPVYASYRLPPKPEQRVMETF
ncbi:MAG: YdiU family protein, partial [Pseudomonadota bacterium]